MVKKNQRKRRMRRKHPNGYTVKLNGVTYDTKGNVAYYIGCSTKTVERMMKELAMEVKRQKRSNGCNLCLYTLAQKNRLYSVYKERQKKVKGLSCSDMAKRLEISVQTFYSLLYWVRHKGYYSGLEKHKPNQRYDFPEDMVKHFKSHWQKYREHRRAKRKKHVSPAAHIRKKMSRVSKKKNVKIFRPHRKLKRK